ncbi:S4 domain-containing protein YaaA [Finegoldia magna]|uniref:S4 domain-containing protein YaaA n=1 Tax=Finegoldia TaxID=150022 RepID=UPI0028055516|nr:S4 domain-containing protein YaaA [Finegoldia magna]MDU1831545.1 S4 domain-containing protein YaaA [Finegoldia magna]MDU1878552.1 S4 domain-containing protein YaaA [Finegoldia magna]MDU5070254.1 S4 domain-containing protein YaaA [Finegoldia magna]MDU5978339.1 S4 domain-containing protein YaaA [Finegoldia magna]MDU5998205.1 S4 domain-containing protein YaaA [Finegoldia magna]
MISVKIESEFIKLEQFLKFASIAQTGGMAKELIKESMVKVNGEIETRRGKKLYPGDEVEFEGEKYVVE